MWLKNTWYVAAFEHELDEQMVARRLLDHPIVMFRASSGEISALDDACPHRLIPLSCGKRVGDTLQCGYHGMKFDASGRCVEIPGQTNIPSTACVKRYPCIARHGYVWIWLGDTQSADERLIPDLHWRSDPGWVSASGYHHFAAHYGLVNDNLLDLSHESYIHTRTIGNEEEETIANYLAKVTVEEDCLVRSHREMENIEPPPFFSAILQHDGPIDRWQTAIHLVPSLNITDAGAYPTGTDKTKAYVQHVLHLLTPETAASTHYFWSNMRNFRLADDALTHKIREAVTATFNEDKDIIEQQQRQLEALKLVPPKVAIRLDEAPMRARRLLDQHIRREADDPHAVIAPPSHLLRDVALAGA